MVKQSVLVLGATGNTGSPIVNALLQSGNFDVIAGVRPPSASKPEVIALKSRGIEIRIVDLENWTAEQIAQQLKGVNTVISTIHFEQVPRQKQLADACKIAGVNRFVPDDWGTACVRGVREMYDQKLAIRDYVKQIGLGYTFIDVSWWMEILLPPTDPSNPFYSFLVDRLQTRYGTGNIKTAVIDRLDIGKFVARIIADDRTLNHYVFCWTEEVTQNEVFALAERASGKKFDIRPLSAEEVAKTVEEAADVEKNFIQYLYSMFIRGDNTVENAKKEEYGGALDARVLYPDIGKELRSVEDFAKDFYSS